MEQIIRQNSMSPREKLIHDKMRQQERLREEQLKETLKKMRQERPKIADQFADVKQGLGKVSEEESKEFFTAMAEAGLKDEL